MDSMQVSLLVLGLVLVFGTHIGSSIECYQCNSKYDEGCDDPINHPKGPDYLLTCDGTSREAILNTTFKYCRKIKQRIEGESRIVRQCGSQARPNLDCAERTGTKNVKVTYCECDENGCNTAPGIFSIQVVLLTTLSALLALICHS